MMYDGRRHTMNPSEMRMVLGDKTKTSGEEVREDMAAPSDCL
jgi:hypothetical protein